MPDLVALTAFGRTEVRRQRFGPVMMAENASLGLASLAIQRDAGVPDVMGLRLPEPGRWSEGAEISAFWTGPGQWMIEMKDGADRDLARDLAAAEPEAAVTSQTDGWVVLELTSDAGPRPIDRTLEKRVNLDLAQFGPGRATRTGLEHMSVFVIRRSPTAVALLGMRSMAGSLWHALETTLVRATAGWA